MTNEILWRASSTQHPWNDGHFLRQLLAQAQDLGLVGPVTWRQRGIKGKSEKINLPTPELLLTQLPEPRSNEPAAAYLEAGGDAPQPWTLKLSIAQLDPQSGELLAPNMAWLFFEGVSTPADSAKLARAFCQLHTPENTEYAFIHPHQHWMDLGSSRYRKAITTGSMFRGVHWANFLGPGHLNEFDLKKLSTLSAYQVQWIANQGLFVIAGPNVLDAQKPSGEKELVRLTEFFRQALRADSKWA